MRKILVFVVIFFLFANQVFASSSYVLPYPSAMPGNVLYKLNLVKESLLRFWYFGDFGQFKYNLKESDKYLVEAKTLFEYEQYFLAFKSLQKSDDYFGKTLPYLLNAQKNRKNISVNRNILREAALKHIQVLSRLAKDLPLIFVWTPEKDKPTTLNIKEKIDQSISIRENFL